MKTVSYTSTSGKRDTAIARSPDRVCMYVIGVARTDPRVMREATALVGAGFAVSIVDIEGETQRPAAEGIQGVCVKHVLMPSWYISTPFPWSLFKAALMYIRTVLRLIGTPADIYHAHDVAALPACYIAAWLRRKPFIFDAHELPLSEMPLSEMTVSRRSIDPVLARLFGAIVPHSAGVIATSSRMAIEIHNRYSLPEVTTVCNFPPYRAVQKSDRLRQFLGLGSDVRIALYQGYLQTDRLLDRLVRAAAFLEQNIVIVMMGKNVGATQSGLEALIASEDVADRVKIVPWVPYEALLDWTASADLGLCILPLDYTSHLKVCLPNKLFEYIMVGLPVLASPLDAIAEVIRTYDVGQVLSSIVPADIGSAINAMLADRDALTRMRRNTLEAAQNVFNWEKESSQLIHLYRKILPMPDAESGMQKISSS